MTRTERLSARVALVAVIFGASLTASAGTAAIFTVDTTVDAVDVAPGDGVCATATGSCSLRAAVMEANSLLGKDTVQLPEGTYVLSLVGSDDASAVGDLDLLDAIRIEGAGRQATFVDASGLDDPVVADPGSPTDPTYEIAGISFQSSTSGVVSGSAGSWTIENCRFVGNSNSLPGGAITMLGGNVDIRDSEFEGNSSASDGGGIFLWGASADLTRVSMTGNSADGGGAIFAGVFGTVRIADSTVANNQTTSGTAIEVQQSPQVSIVNSTVTGNSQGGVGISEAAVAIAFSTIVGNGGAGLYTYDSPPWLRGTILTGNTGGDCEIVLNSGVAISEGFNIIGDVSGCQLTLDPTDVAGTPSSPVNPMLGALMDNGGPTMTYKPLGGSPAVDAVPPSSCEYDDDGLVTTPPLSLTADQRGRVRPRGTGCEIGSVELQPATGSPTCGLGMELVPILGLLVRRRRRVERRFG